MRLLCMWQSPLRNISRSFQEASCLLQAASCSSSPAEGLKAHTHPGRIRQDTPCCTRRTGELQLYSSFSCGRVLPLSQTRTVAML